MKNMSILDRNIIAALNDGEAEAMYFRLKDRITWLEAEVAAYQWRDLVARLRPMLNAAERLYGVRDVGVVDYIRERFYRRYAPDFVVAP